MKDAWVEHKNKTALATSSGVPILFIGAMLIAGFNASTISFEVVVMGVSITPGQTQFTRMSLSE
jgi:hypothetical protein